MTKRVVESRNVMFLDISVVALELGLEDKTQFSGSPFNYGDDNDL